MSSTRRAFASVVTSLALILAGGAKASDEKQELVLQLIDAAGGGDMAHQITTAMVQSMQQSYTAMIQQLIDSQPELGPDERTAITEHLADYDRFEKRFSKALVAAVDFDSLLAEVYAPLYSEHFTEGELRELLAFQLSPTGQKSTKLLPTLMQEGMVALTPKIQPIVVEVVERILREEQAIALGN